MQLYTVKFDQARLVSKFDAKGNKIADQTIMVRQTIADLPLPTAQMYKQTDTHGTVEIIRQDMSAFGRNGISEKRKHQVEFADVKSGRSSRAEPARTTKTAAPAPDRHKAARTGDMSAAINAGE